MSLVLGAFFKFWKNGFDIYDILKLNGINVNKADDKGMTALSHIVSHRLNSRLDHVLGIYMHDAVNKLLAAGAEVNHV